VKAIKAGARAAIGLPEAEAMEVELRHGGPVFRTQDAIEGPRAFMEKRQPQFQGR
jgi:enoyl-CoA hydratase